MKIIKNMPKPDKFLAAFGLVKGQQFGDYKIKHVSATHEVVKQYQEYFYEIIITFSGGKDYNALYDDLQHEIRQKHDVRGIRNYYTCSIDRLKNGDIVEDNDKVIFYLTGHAHRN